MNVKLQDDFFFRKNIDKENKSYELKSTTVN